VVVVGEGWGACTFLYLMVERSFTLPGLFPDLFLLPSVANDVKRELYMGRGRKGKNLGAVC
jgi:hypothetical protein